MFRRALALVLAVLPLLAGCGHIYQCPCDCPPVWRPSDSVPDAGKACVHVFLFDSFDPFAVGRMGDVRDHLQELGFGNTYYGWPHHLSHFEEEMGTVNAERPDARFAIIGYGTGAEAARKLAAFADAVGIPVDVVIYLEPPFDPREAPVGAMNTFTLREMDLEAGAATAGTFVGRHVHKSDVASHPMTLELIDREVTLVGLGVPVPPRHPAPPVVLVPPMPAPRAVIPIPKELPPEWQFLRTRAPWLQLAPPMPTGAEPLPYPKLLPELPPPKAAK
jgi:hypothetical protein